MEIRFCERCEESIPEGEFETGRAVSVDGRTFHVACAVQRSMVLGGPRTWLSLALALYAAGVATFLLVALLGGWFAPPESTGVSDEVDARIAERAERAREEAESSIRRAIDVERAAREEALGRLAPALDREREEVGRVRERLAQVEQNAHDHVRVLQERAAAMENQIGRLQDWIREVSERARERAPPQPSQPPEPAPEAQEPDETPEEGPVTPKRPVPDPRRDAEVTAWIQRLGDSDAAVRMTAALELGNLRDLRATGPLLKVLAEDRDFYPRMGAAAALGDLEAADAVPALVDALADREPDVRTAANESLRRITEHRDVDFVASMPRGDRTRAQRQWREWWKENEAAVRARLEQPAPGSH